MIIKILETLILINHSRGRGAITGFQMDADSNGGTATRRPWGCDDETRKFRFNWANHQITFLGTTRIIHR